jgi:hypothetical protein
MTMGIKGNIADNIQRGLDREIDAIESNDFLTPEERAREIRDLERSARWEYQEECARSMSDEEW